MRAYDFFYNKASSLAIGIFISHRLSNCSHPKQQQNFNSSPNITRWVSKSLIYLYLWTKFFDMPANRLPHHGWVEENEAERKREEWKAKIEEDRGKSELYTKLRHPALSSSHRETECVSERMRDDFFVTSSRQRCSEHNEKAWHRLENWKEKIENFFFHLRSSSSCSSSLRHVVCASCYESIMIFPSATTTRCSTIFFSCFKCFSRRGRETQHTTQ